MMVLLGITAAACSPPLKWFAFSVACCFGGMVFASVAQCFRALYLIVPAYAYAKGAARCLVGAMGFAFIGGWLLFPLVFALGHLGAGLISRDLEAVGQFFGATKTLQPRASQAATVCIQAAPRQCAQAASVRMHTGDVLAKNSFVALGCVVKGQYLRSSPRLAAGAVIASSDTPGRFHQADGAMTDDAMQSAQGARRAPPNLPAPRPAPTPYATPYATPPAPRPLRHAPCATPLLAGRDHLRRSLLQRPSAAHDRRGAARVGAAARLGLGLGLPLRGGRDADPPDPHEPVPLPRAAACQERGCGLQRERLQDHGGGCT
jgi:hypothetical protein